jgi:hypothetical protein
VALSSRLRRRQAFDKSDELSALKQVARCDVSGHLRLPFSMVAVFDEVAICKQLTWLWDSAFAELSLDRS